MAITIPEEAPRTTATDAAFESEIPYKLAPSDFKEAVEIADTLVAGTEIGEEIIDFSRPIYRHSLRCPYCHSLDGEHHFDAAQCICKE